MDQEKSHENLREYARELETNLDVLAEFADAKFSSVRGGTKDFPRPAPESRAGVRCPAAGHRGGGGSTLCAR
jgi:hypothetical protein